MKLKFKDMEVAMYGANAVQARHDFKNGYGVSVVRHSFSYGHENGNYELAVFKHGNICYDTEITDDVLGDLTIKEAEDIAERVMQLPAAEDGE